MPILQDLVGNIGHVRCFFLFGYLRRVVGSEWAQMGWKIRF